jgi:SSS family solute:Na+ symporter
MTAFAILGSSGHAFNNGIVTFGLMASSSGLVIPFTIYLMGTRLWALGKRHGFMTPVQLFRDRWECSHIGTVIFAVQAALLVPYVVIGVMGGGTTLEAVSEGLVPYWLGGAVVAMVVMSYVFFGGMRGTAWVNTFQTVLFLVFGAVAVSVIAHGMGGFRQAAEAMLASPATAPLMTRERFSPLQFFSYTFVPLSAMAFPHMAIFCLTARRMSQFKKTVTLYPLCIAAIWLPCVFLGVMANRASDIPEIKAKQDARRVLATQGATLAPEAREELREKMAGDDVLLLLLHRYAPLWLAGLLGAGIMAAVMASDSQILALSTMFTEDVFAI